VREKMTNNRKRKEENALTQMQLECAYVEVNLGHQGFDRVGHFQICTHHALMAKILAQKKTT
jgi:hypothetical protein